MMNNPKVRAVSGVLAGCLCLGAGGAALAAELSATTANAIGATNFYSVNCADSNTDHLGVSILDETAAAPSNTVQVLNVQIKKGSNKAGFQTVDGSGIEPGEKTELTLPAGKGTYTVTVDTLGTESGVTNPEAYTAEYTCLNDLDELTKPAKARTKTAKVKIGKTSKFSIICGKSKTAGETTKLTLSLTNTTVDPAKIALNAQIVKGTKATNTTDFNGDAFYSPEASLNGGSGLYKVLVDNTAFDSNQDNTRSFTLQYSCQDTDDNPLATGQATLIDQVP